MITTWRIVKAEHASEAFSGKGAALNAGRWHSDGTRVVYTAQSISLATLEIIVHMRHRRHIPDYMLIPCYFHEVLAEALDLEALPKNWADAIAPTELRRFGDEWAASRASAVLIVPSAVTQVEFNYLLNPEHPDFHMIDVGEPRPFHMDVRLYT